MAYLFPRSEANLPPPPTPEELISMLVLNGGEKDDRGYVAEVADGWQCVLGNGLGWLKRKGEKAYRDIMEEVKTFVEYARISGSAEFKDVDGDIHSVIFKGDHAEEFANSMHEEFGYTVVLGVEGGEGGMDVAYRNIVKYFIDNEDRPAELQKKLKRMLTYESFTDRGLDPQVAKVVLIGTPADRAAMREFLTSPLPDETLGRAAAAPGAPEETETDAKAKFEEALQAITDFVNANPTLLGSTEFIEFDDAWTQTDAGKAMKEAAEAAEAVRTPGDEGNISKYQAGTDAVKLFRARVINLRMEMLQAEIAEIKTSLEGMGVTKKVTSFTFKDLPAIPPLPPRREEPWSTDAIDWLLKRRYLTTKEKLRSDVSIYSTGRLGEYDQGSSFTDVERESTEKGRKMRPLIISILTGEVPEGATLSILSDADLYFLRQYLDNIRKVLKDKRLSSIKIDEDTPVVTIRLLLADIYDALKYEERQFITALSNLYWLHLYPKELELREELNV